MYYVNPNIKNLERVFHDYDREKYLRLDMNENPEGLPESFVQDVLSNIDSEFLARYPFYNNLINKISKYISVDKECIVVTNGSDMAIRYIFEVFTKEKGRVISVDPTFEMYNVYCKMYGLEHVKVNYKNDFTIDIEEIINSINENTNLIVLLNPNSPIGNVYSEENVRRIIKRANKYNAIVIIDEAYYYFHDNTYINLINEYKNVILIRTFSKLCSIASCRVGFLVSNENIVKYIKNYKLSYDVNGIGVKFAEAILDSPNLINELIDLEKNGKKYIVDRLKKEKYEYYSQNGNYIFIKTKNNPKIVYENLKNIGILVKTYNCDIFKDYIRVTTGSKEIMSKFIEKLLLVDS